MNLVTVLLISSSDMVFVNYRFLQNVEFLDK